MSFVMVAASSNAFAADKKDASASEEVAVSALGQKEDGSESCPCRNNRSGAKPGVSASSEKAADKSAASSAK